MSRVCGYEELAFIKLGLRSGDGLERVRKIRYRGWICLHSDSLSLKQAD
jgi:hypothetical protein